MNYDSEETRKQEELLAELFEQINRQGPFTEEDKETFDNCMKALEEQVKKLQAKPKLNKEELEMLDNVDHRIQKLLKGMQDTKLILDQKLCRQALVIYQHLKAEAEKGNPEAKKAFERLDKTYQKMMKKQLSVNKLN